MAELTIGMPVAEIETPAMVADEDLLNKNLTLMGRYFQERACRLRPHFKSHKCVELARRQLAAGGAVGVTCAKLSEAEVVVAGGIGDVLIANQVVGERKARRLAALNRRATVRAAVDSAENVHELSCAARESGVTIGVLVEVDIGMHRCGVPPGEAAVALARLVAESPGLRFDGLQGYEGHLVCLPDCEERKRKVMQAFKPLLETREMLERAGLLVKIVSGGGTGTYDITGNIAGIDEVQAGSYALMDAYYRKVRPEFHVARWVQSRIISAGRGWAVADVGTKGLGGEFGLPEVMDQPGATVRRIAEEHTIIEGLDAHVGQTIRLVPSHGCTTNNLYDRMWVARAGKVTAVWPIEGRGCLE